MLMIFVNVLSVHLYVCVCRCRYVFVYLCVIVYIDCVRSHVNMCCITWGCRKSCRWTLHVLFRWLSTALSDVPFCETNKMIFMMMIIINDDDRLIVTYPIEAFHFQWPWVTLKGRIQRTGPNLGAELPAYVRTVWRRETKFGKVTGEGHVSIPCPNTRGFDHHFHYPGKFQSTVKKHEGWCKTIHAFRI